MDQYGASIGPLHRPGGRTGLRGRIGLGDWREGAGPPFGATHHDSGPQRAPIRRLLSEGTLSLYTIFLRCFCSCVPYCSHVERQRLRTLVFVPLWCRPAAWVRTSHPSGSRSWEGLPSGRPFPRPWQRCCPRKPSVPYRVQKRQLNFLLPYGSNPWVAHGMGVPVVAPHHARLLAGWDSGQSGLVVVNQPLVELTVPAHVSHPKALAVSKGT